jgi:hypothetical protein
MITRALINKPTRVPPLKVNGITVQDPHEKLEFLPMHSTNLSHPMLLTPLLLPIIISLKITLKTFDPIRLRIIIVKE